MNLSRIVRVGAVGLVVLAASLGLTTTASAGTVSSTSATVDGGRVFTPWGDDRWFEPLPGGTADASYRLVQNRREGWTSFRDAGFSRGGTPWDVWRSGSRQVVELEDDEACAVLWTWSNTVDDVRFFYEAGRRGALLDVRITSYSSSLVQQDQTYYRLRAPSSGWNVSPALSIDTKGRTGFSVLSIEFFSLDDDGFLLDDVSIDPWRPR